MIHIVVSNLLETEQYLLLYKQDYLKLADFRSAEWWDATKNDGRRGGDALLRCPGGVVREKIQ